jgi:uncharacterized membrane protein (TIGR02234 family)
VAEPSRRRTFLPAVAVGIGGAALVAVAGNQGWVEPAGDTDTEAVAQVAATAADASSPLATAVALVALACWGVILVTRGGFRRFIAWFGAVVGLALVVVVMLGWARAPEELSDLFAVYGVAETDVRRTAWCWVAVGAAVLAFAASLLAARDVRSWPQMGSRYDAPRAAADGDELPATPPEEQSSLELWKSLDEGTDPTERERHP